MDDINKDKSEEDNDTEDKNKLRDKDQLKMRKSVHIKNDEDEKIQQRMKRDEKVTKKVGIVKLTSKKKQGNEKLKLHPQQQVPSHEVSSLTKAKKKKKSQNLSETTPTQMPQLESSPDQSTPTQLDSLYDPISLNKILPASDAEDLTKLSSMGVVELVAATRDLEEKLLQLSAIEHTKIYISLNSSVPWFEDVREMDGLVDSATNEGILCCFLCCLVKFRGWYNVSISRSTKSPTHFGRTGHDN